MIRSIVFGCLCVANAVTAQERADCSQAMTQLEMNECAATDFELADKELNTVYNAIIAKQGQDAGFIRKLRAAQRAWVAFRDAELEAAFFCKDGFLRACFGSIGSMSYSARKAQLTRDRTSQLREMMRERACPGCG